MSLVIERLKASKAEYIQQQQSAGTKEGKEWALTTASYEDLRTLVGSDHSIGPYYQGSLHEYANRLMEIEDPHDGLFYNEDTGGAYPDEYIRAFLDGAQEVWHEVKHQL